MSLRAAVTSHASAQYETAYRMRASVLAPIDEALIGRGASLGNCFFADNFVPFMGDFQTETFG